jgi:two-component system, response regulator YesN
VEKKRILVVDDEEMNRTLFSLFLKQLFSSCSVKTAENGKEAMAVIAGGFVPDVIVCDIRMPEMDGIEFFRALGEFGFEIGWLFTTGTLFEREQKFIIENELECLEKPFTMGQFESALKNLFEE